MDLGEILIEHLDLRPKAMVALVGGGGKSTLMAALVEAGRRRGWRAGGGTTTKVWASQADELIGFVASHREQDKVIGLSAAEMDQRYVSGGYDLLVVEADGSRGKVVKAPAAHEPPVPSLATVVLALIGADGINRVIEDVAHRPMLTAAVCQCGPYERLTPARAARLVSSERGLRRHVPDTARYVVVITRIGPRQIQAAEELSVLLRRDGLDVIELPRI
jgi:probable selenium-dependent hydroxylase accessory protein YqeC